MSFATYLGPAISNAGDNVSQFGSDQNKLRLQLALMAQQRADKINEENRQNSALKIEQDQNARAQTEADRATGAAKDRKDFEDLVANGKPLPAPQGTELDPSAQPTDPGLVQPITNVPLTQDEVVHAALAKGLIDPDKYLEYTRAKQITPSADVQDYLVARQQDPGLQFLDFLKAKAVSTHIDVTGAADVRAKQGEVNSLRSGNASATKDYDTTKRAALAFNQDYQRYKAIQASGNPQAIKVAQQGMLDKYITSSTGKSTGDAQFNNFRDSQGLTNKVQNLYSKIMDGSMAPDEAFEEMRRITMGTAESMRQKTKQANAATTSEAQAALPRLGFIDPREAIVHPDDMLHQDSASFAVPAPHPQDDQAVAWAKANPQDPRSAKILQANGAQ